MSFKRLCNPFTEVLPKALSTVLFATVLFGCSTSHESPEVPQAPEEQEQEQEQDNDNKEEETPPEQLSCNASVPLSIAEISSSTTNNNGLDKLIDGNKTNNSTWPASVADEQITLTLDDYALVKDLVLTWGDSSIQHYFDIEVANTGDNWQSLLSNQSTEKNHLIPTRIQFVHQDSVKQLRITIAANERGNLSELLEIEVFGCTTDIASNIELIDWYLSVPTDENDSGTSDSIKETDLAAGYYDPRFFHLSPDNGLTFKTSVSGYKTSNNTKYVRSELREMLRRGDTSHKTQGVNPNNWVFSSAPQEDLNNAGGIDGVLHAKVAVNHVTTTGEDYQIGRVIIGQIHANDDEPIRLYYRKLPNNLNGSVYFAHEFLDGDDSYYQLIGDRGNDANNPSDGIPLNEPFEYTIEVIGNQLNVTLKKQDGTEYFQQVDMSTSGYDTGGQYMYFKAGVYNQNNSGDQHDYVQATFYQLDNTHDGYNP